MRESLGEIAESGPGLDINLFGKQPDIVREAQDVLESPFGGIEAPRRARLSTAQKLQIPKAPSRVGRPSEPSS